MLTSSYLNIRKIIPTHVEILFACKYATDEQIKELLKVDLPLLFGENYVQQAQKRTVKIPRDRYHFIGHLQRNKVLEAVKLFGTIQSVDSVALAKKISQVSQEQGVTTDLYIQVKLDTNESQSGIQEGELDELVRCVKNLPSVRLIGLMTLGTVTGDKIAAFKKLHALAKKHHLKTSMGMSEDYQEAIKEGSNMVRVGRLLIR